MSQSSTAGSAKPRRINLLKRGLLILLCTVVGWFILGRIAQKSAHRTPNSTSTGMPTSIPTDSELKAEWQAMKDAHEAMLPVAPARGLVDGIAEPMAYGTPMIAHGAELLVATKEFARSRATLEEILDRHHGYAAKLRMIGQPSGSLLSATLRVPSTEFNGAVSDLKALGNVEREEETANEITQQRADVEARLTNAQNRLQRLQEMLGKNQKTTAGNPVDGQKQLSSVSAEIAQLEAERTAAEHSAVFANIFFSLREEIAQPVESLTAQLRNSAVTGLSDALTSSSGILIFLLGHGPVLLLWATVLYFPVRYAWRNREKWIKSEARKAATA